MPSAEQSMPLGVPQGASQPRAEQEDATEFSDGEIDWEAAATEAGALEEAAQEVKAAARCL